nr:hypothetical protein [Nocardioides piscis]
MDADLVDAVPVPVAHEGAVRPDAVAHLDHTGSASEQELRGLRAAQTEVGDAVAVPVADQGLVGGRAEPHHLCACRVVEDERRLRCAAEDRDLGGAVAGEVPGDRDVDAVGRDRGAIGERHAAEGSSNDLLAGALLEVEVRAARVAGVADGPEHGALVDVLAGRDQHLVEVGIDRALTVAVVDDDVVSIAAGADRVGLGHDPRGGGHDRVALVTRTVEVDRTGRGRVAPSRRPGPGLAARERRLVRRQRNRVGDSAGDEGQRQGADRCGGHGHQQTSRHRFHGAHFALTGSADGFGLAHPESHGPQKRAHVTTPSACLSAQCGELHRCHANGELG